MNTNFVEVEAKTQVPGEGYLRSWEVQGGRDTNHPLFFRTTQVPYLMRKRTWYSTPKLLQTP